MSLKFENAYYLDDDKYNLVMYNDSIKIYLTDNKDVMLICDPYDFIVGKIHVGESNVNSYLFLGNVESSFWTITEYGRNKVL